MGFRVNADEIKTNYTETLSRFTAELKYEDIPQEVRERAKYIAMQTIGVSLAAKGTLIADRAVELGKFSGGVTSEGGATLWTTGEKSSVVGAVFCNSTLADALDWEDCSWTGHPSAGIIPVAFAVAEAEHKSGKDFITAIVAGYEVYQRIAMAVQPPENWPNYKGWGLTSWQVFAGVIPAAWLYNLNAEQVNQAIGFGVTQCPIPGQLHHVTMSDAYHYEHGYRSVDGVLAAKNAKLGVSNYTEALDDPWSFENHMSVSPSPEWYTKDLGKRWLTLETLLKHWPANMWIQTPLELTEKLLEQHQIQKDDIAEIIVDPPTFMRMYYSDEGYSSMMQAQFSIPFMLASLILDRVPGANWCDEQKLHDAEILNLASKIHGGPSEMLYMPKCFKNFQKGKHPVITVTIKTNDGKEYSETMEGHLGHPRMMMTPEQFKERFRIQAAPALKGDVLEQVIEVLADIENCEDIAEVGALLRS
ncbi:MAG: MmgE/PrpD family protein [Eubacteriales bacterium]|nr:MmgE/PrpD family protein [Eubacteriales bacterium]